MAISSQIIDLLKSRQLYSFRTVLLINRNQQYIDQISLNLVNILLCEDKKKFVACHVCRSCKLFATELHLDFLHIVPDNNLIKINAIRNIIEFSYAKPQINNNYNKKIILINQAHLMNDYASNALLKILEDSLSSVFILTTTDSKALLPTGLSRCQLKLNVYNEQQLVSLESSDIAGLILQDLHKLWVQKTVNTTAVVNKWLAMSQQELLYWLWRVVVNIIYNQLDGQLGQYSQQIAHAVARQNLWNMFINLNNIYKSINYLNIKLNWQLCLEKILFI